MFFKVLFVKYMISNWYPAVQSSAALFHYTLISSFDNSAPTLWRRCFCNLLRYLGHVLNIFSSCPNKHQEIADKEGSHEADHHGILREGPKQLSGPRRVDEVGSDEERAPKEGEVVAEALGDQMSGLNAHLDRKVHI